VQSINTVAVVLVFTVGAARGQSADLDGEWRVGTAGAIFTLAYSRMPPLAAVRKGLGYTYILSSPVISILQGMPSTPQASGFLQAQGDRRFEGELATSGGCWMHLSLAESEDGSILSGSGTINTKISTRSCRSMLAKEARSGQPFSYTLTRVK